MGSDFQVPKPLAERLVPFKITAIYTVIGGLWILFSDEILAALIHDPAALTRLQTFKGWFYVLATALMLHLLIRRGIKAVRQSEEALHETARGVSAATGAAFFNSLVRHLAKVLKVDCVLIGQVSGDNEEKIQTVAVYAHGEIKENFTYHLPGTPCENVVRKDMCYYPAGVRELFPDDHLLAEMKVESYLGTPLFDSAGRVSGLLVVMNTKPLPNTDYGQSLLRIYAVRAAAELERKRAEERLTYMAYHDPLTDLPNRTLFYDRLSLALAHARRLDQMLAVLFIDLDQFKNINDSLGHATGDMLLQGAAGRLSSCIRAGDTLARMGGDEFTLLLPGIHQAEDAVKVARKIFDAFKQPWVLGGHEFHLTVSIGISVYPNDGVDPETLLKNADTAMHRAKELGRNSCQFYNPEMKAKILERLAMEKSLRYALEHDEFVICYQPQVHTGTGGITGIEALVRWQSPDRGLISPDRFIPLAEDTGLILPIGEWVLRTACAQNKAWQEAGFPSVRVAVNLSPYQFRQETLVETVVRVLKETGLEPCWLELEITESAAMYDVDYTIAVLHELRDMGIRIAIDDFGTGYSCLNCLKQFPINRLKIDQSFVSDAVINPASAAIVTTIITLANNLNLEAIAEGVETEEQLAFLKQCRCGQMQGYLFGEPVPAGEFEKILGRTFACRVEKI